MNTQKKTLTLTIIMLTAFLLSAPAVYALDLAESYFIDPASSKRVSMDFKNASLEDVLKIFSQQSNLNFIASNDIADKSVSLYLENVPVEEALERILHANDLKYEIVPGSDIFIVKQLPRPKDELVTKIYHLQYASVESSSVNSTFTIEEEDSSEEGGGGGGPSNSTSDSEGPIGIVAALESVLSNKGKIIENTRTNSLVISDIPSQFPIIEQTIANLDIPLVQVLIEVEMLDVSKTVGDQIGIRYGASPLVFTGGVRNHVYPWNVNSLLNKGRFAFDEEFETGEINASGLSATLQFLRSDSETKNLARPRIITLNNQKAEIKISTDETIGIETNTSGQEGLATQSVEPERTETGVFLTVTPQANVSTGEITLALAPRVIDTTTGEAFNGTTFRDPEERATKSILRVRTGDTIVLGGLIRTEGTKTVTKLPFFGDLPFVGGAFRHKSDTETERELIIFITPHIITGDTQAQFANSDFPRIQREQDFPTRREQEVERTLAVFDNKRL